MMCLPNMLRVCLLLSMGRKTADPVFLDLFAGSIECRGQDDQLLGPKCTLASTSFDKPKHCARTHQQISG
jgi:hypothetical protein